MVLTSNIDRARELATRLYGAFSASGEGIFGKTDMPEDDPPDGAERGSLEHILFVTFTMSIDYSRKSDLLWAASRRAFADPCTRYLFDPKLVREAGRAKVGRDMQQVGISQRITNDPKAWYTIAETLVDKWEGDPRNFLKDCDWHAPTVLRRLVKDEHPIGTDWEPDFPYLRGPKVGRVWIRMLRDNLAIELRGLEDVHIPVDVHILRATLCTGALTGSFSGPRTSLFPKVQELWHEATAPLKRPHDQKPLIALDVDAALWTLSKKGCSKRIKDRDGNLGPCHKNCPASPSCASGKIIIESNKQRCEIDTE